MSQVTRSDVERAVHKARSLVTLKPLHDDMAIVSGPEGRDDRPRGLSKVRGAVRRQRLDIAIASLGLDGITWRDKARMIGAMAHGATMESAICREIGIERCE